MKHLSILLFVGLITGPFLTAQSLTFTRYYGGTQYDDARAIVATADGGFVFTGLSNSGADAKGDMYLTKINAAGAVMWTKYYGRLPAWGHAYIHRCLGDRRLVSTGSGTGL
jgi:hypothetical protein